MTTDEYKQLCNQPNAFSRKDLEITEKVLINKNGSVALHLSKILQASPITKPEKHQGDKFTDYFLISLSESDVETIIDVFTDLEAESLDNNRMTTPSASFYGGIVDKWLRYLSSF